MRYDEIELSSDILSCGWNSESDSLAEFRGIPNEDNILIINNDSKVNSVQMKFGSTWLWVTNENGGHV
jgi:hypothetical protein